MTVATLSDGHALWNQKFPSSSTFVSALCHTLVNKNPSATMSAVPSRQASPKTRMPKLSRSLSTSSVLWGSSSFKLRKGKPHLRHAALWLFTERHSGGRHRHEAEGEGVLQMV